MIIGRPARELGPFDRLKLAVRELQRFFGQCGVGRQTQDHANDACDHAAHTRMRKPTIGLQASNRIADMNGGPGGAS
jgi:hypothetical protein